MKTPTHITIRMSLEFKEMAQKKADKKELKLSTYIKNLIKNDQS